MAAFRRPFYQAPFRNIDLIGFKGFIAGHYLIRQFIAALSLRRHCETTSG
jgi:hypothetical protein